MGLMPHPERASEAILGNTDGKNILASMLSHVAIFKNSCKLPDYIQINLKK